MSMGPFTLFIICFTFSEMDVLLSYISASTSLWNLYNRQFTINQSLLTEAFIRETRSNKYLSV